MKIESKNLIYNGENLDILKGLSTASVDLVVTDPPYNTRKQQKRCDFCYSDSHSEYIGFMRERLIECHRLLKHTGSLFIFCDYHESHYLKVLLDGIFGRKNFRNEIIWAYDFGGRGKSCWPKKHDTIFWYTKSNEYTFNYDEIDRIPYLAPGLCGKEKASRGKIPTDVWWSTIVHTSGKEKTGYPTQKPLKIIERIIRVHSNPGDVVLDPFAGSGTTGAACELLGRSYILIDSNQQALEIMKKRLKSYEIKETYGEKNYICESR